MSLMLAFRVAVVVLLACFTSCIVGSIFLPLFRLNALNFNERTLITDYYYRYIENGAVLPRGQWAGERIPMCCVACETMQLYYGWSFALSLLAACSGAIATVAGVSWISAGQSVMLSTGVLACTAVSCVCSTVVLGLMARAYHFDICAAGSGASAALSAVGFEKVEGFFLLAIAMVGFSVLSILQFLGFRYQGQAGKYMVARSGFRRAFKGLMEEEKERDEVHVIVSEEVKFE